MFQLRSNPPEALPDVRRAEARSAGIRRPDGVARSFQVSVYKVEPSEAVLARNLLAKDDVRAALLDEMMERGPKVPLVIEPAAFACRAERLAGAGAGPDRAVVSPSSKAQGVRPDSNASEGVELGEAGDVVGFKVTDVSFVHDARRDVAGADELAQPGGRVLVDFVVKSGHRRRPSICANAMGSRADFRRLQGGQSA